MKLKHIIPLFAIAVFTYACSDKKENSNDTDKTVKSDSVTVEQTEDSLVNISDTIVADGFDISLYANDNLSYGFGVFIGLPLKDLGLTNLIVSEMQASYTDVQKGNKMKYDMMEVQTTLRSFFQEVNAKGDLKKFDMKKVSYCLGFDIGTKTNGLMSMSAEKLFAGIQDALNGKASVSLDDAKKEIEKLNTDIETINKKIENDFLAWNKTQDGVITTASGLQYKIIKQGTGKIPNKNSKVKTHYTGTFLNGNIFDSSYKRNEPIEFQVTGVISGWTEALLLMPEGSKWELYIPSALAYGNQPNPSIPPGSTLKFEIELLSFK